MHDNDKEFEKWFSFVFKTFDYDIMKREQLKLAWMAGRHTGLYEAVDLIVDCQGNEECGHLSNSCERHDFADAIRVLAGAREE